MPDAPDIANPPAARTANPSAARTATLNVGLILGAAVWATGPSPTLRRRTAQAARLFQDGHVTHLIACGGIGRHPPAEAHAMRDMLRAAGVPHDAILCEDRSATTEENIRFALPLLASLGMPPVIIVTDLTHAPRARLVARRAGLRATSCSPPLRGHRPGPLIRQALRECVAYPAYLITGRGRQR